MEEHFAQIPARHSLLTAPLSHDLRDGMPDPVEPPVATLNESPAETCDRLRSEIKRARDYLAQAERDLAESRAQLEAWPVYERICGKNPLEHLTHSVLVNERIARFLAGWLERRQAELNRLSRKEPSLAENPAAHATRTRSAGHRKSSLQRSAKARLAA